MTRVDAGVHGRRALQALRRRVRVRTRLRRTRDAWRRAFPRRLPAWAERTPQSRTAADGQVELVVATCGGLRREFDEGQVRSVRVVVEDWQAPHAGWSGRLGPLAGLAHHEVDLPAGGRGRAVVTVTLAEPTPLPRVVAAARRVLDPSPAAAAGGNGGLADGGAANPRGRQRYGPSLPAGELVCGGTAWQVTRASDGVVVVAGRVGEPLDERQRAALAGLGLLRLAPGIPAAGDGGSPGGGDVGPTAWDAGLVAQLAMTGVVLHTPDEEVPGLANELAATLAAPLPTEDPIEWEIRSVRQRRTAMRHHAAGLAAPPVSALLVSKRPDLAAAQVAVLAAQTYPELEIVVALHGAGEPPTLRAAAGDRPLQVVTVPPERNLGQALQAASAAAQGNFLTKVDDDDRYGPEHVWDLVLAHHYSGATVAGKGSELVYVEPKDVTVRRRMGAEFFTDTVAGGTMALPAADLAAAGGWPPVPRHVDRALLDRVIEDGGLVYRTHPLGFIYTRHGDGHTWQADLDYFLHDTQRKWPGLPPYPELGGG